MSESHNNNQAVLRKATQPAAVTVIVQAVPERDRSLGLAASSAFLILARAFYEWATGSKPKCKSCGCKI